MGPTQPQVSLWVTERAFIHTEEAEARQSWKQRWSDQRQVKECWQPPEAWRRAVPSPLGPLEGHCSGTTWYCAFGIQNGERINFCCSKHTKCGNLLSVIGNECPPASHSFLIQGLLTSYVRPLLWLGGPCGEVAAMEQKLRKCDQALSLAVLWNRRGSERRSANLWVIADKNKPPPRPGRQMQAEYACCDLAFSLALFVSDSLSTVLGVWGQKEI